MAVKKGERKGQFSMEFLAVTAFGFLVLVGIAVALLTQVGSRTAEIDAAQLTRFANTLMNGVSKVNYMGETSVITLEPSMPAGVTRIYMENSRLMVFNFENKGRSSNISFSSPVNVSIDFSDLSKGIKTLMLKEKAGYVLVCQKDGSKRCNSYCDTASESASTAPSDCCTASCNSCVEDGSYLNCKNDSLPYESCCRHNGCSATCK